MTADEISASPALRYAGRVAGVTGSVIDASLSLLAAQTHDVVRLAMGSPAASAMPAAAFAELLPHIAAPDAFDYTPTEGDGGLREQLLALLEATGESTPAEELLVTAGGMQGLDLVCKLFVQAGDLVAVESPTYTNGVATITGYEGELLEIPTDDEGMDVDALAELVARAGRAPRMVYTVPTFQNPAGTTLSLARRERLIELAAAWDALILEDDPYGLLHFEGRTYPSLRGLASGRAAVIGVHTFSKILAPGLRVGWVRAEAPTIAKMVDARQAMDTCANTLQQRLVAAFLAAGRWDEHLAGLRAEYRERKQRMLEALDEHLGPHGARWTDPEGGFFTWVTLPPELDTEALFPHALREGVAYVPGNAFSPGGRFPSALRIAFSAEEPARAREGVRRLAAAISTVRAGTPAVA